MHWRPATSRSRQIALTALKLRESDPVIAARLFIFAYRTAQTSEARSALLDASATSAPTRYVGGAGHGPRRLEPGGPDRGERRDQRHRQPVHLLW